MDTLEHVGDSEPLAARIARRRTEQGLSRPELARRVGISHHYLWRIERGPNQPSTALAETLARALEVSVADLVDGVEHSDAAKL